MFNNIYKPNKKQFLNIFRILHIPIEETLKNVYINVTKYLILNLFSTLSKPFSYGLLNVYKHLEFLLENLPNQKFLWEILPRHHSI